MIKVIGFDLDDTLWAVKPIIEQAETRLDEWLTANLSEMKYTVTTMRSLREEVLEEMPELLHRITALRRCIIERAMLLSGIGKTDAAHLSNEAMEVFLAARNEIEFHEGAMEAIIELSDRFVLGALTNGNADIDRLGLRPYFSFSFSAEQVGAPKPAPDLFEHALSYTQVSPDEMIYVGDNPVLDIDAANNLGLHTIWINNGQREPGMTSADVTIDHVRDLKDAVGTIIDYPA